MEMKQNKIAQSIKIVKDILNRITKNLRRSTLSADVRFKLNRNILAYIKEQYHLYLLKYVNIYNGRRNF